MRACTSWRFCAKLTFNIKRPVITILRLGIVVWFYSPALGVRTQLGCGPPFPLWKRSQWDRFGFTRLGLRSPEEDCDSTAKVPETVRAHTGFRLCEQ